MPIRVAIVDDHTLVREALASILAEISGIEVIGAAGTGHAALRLVAAERPDVVLLDIALGEENGLDLIAPIRKLNQTTHVLALSMHSEPEYARQARLQGASGLIAKADDVDELVAAVRQVARGSTLPVEGELLARERTLLAQLRRGCTVEEMASALRLQPRTVETYLQRLMVKLDIHTRAGLVGYAQRLDL